MPKICGVVVVGDRAVGKSTLIDQFAVGEFHDQYCPTVGVGARVKKGFNIKKKPYVVTYTVFERPPTDHFYRAPESFFKHMSVLVVAYSITSEPSLREAARILDFLEGSFSKDKRFIVGLKANLEDERTVTREAGEGLARKYGSSFREINSKDYGQVHELFATIAELLPVKEDPKAPEKDSHQEQQNQQTSWWEPISRFFSWT